MKVIIDTNVLIAALLSSNGFPGQMLQAWKNARFTLLTSKHQIQELREVSRYPKLRSRVPAHIFGALINGIQQGNSIVLEHLSPVDAQAFPILDPDDLFLIAMTLDGNADFLVTGDRKSGLLAIGKIRNASIMTPAGFCHAGWA